MSQTQRQKKRYSQFKKKHFDGKARGGPKEERRSEPGSHGRQAASEATAKQTSKRATHDSPRERKEGSPKYSTRTVASNWERYGDGEPSHVEPNAVRGLFSLHFLRQQGRGGIQQPGVRGAAGTETSAVAKSPASPAPSPPPPPRRAVGVREVEREGGGGSGRGRGGRWGTFPDA